MLLSTGWGGLPSWALFVPLLREGGYAPSAGIGLGKEGNVVLGMVLLDASKPRASSLKLGTASGLGRGGEGGGEGGPLCKFGLLGTSSWAWMPPGLRAAGTLGFAQQSPAGDALVQWEHRVSLLGSTTSGFSCCTSTCPYQINNDFSDEVIDCLKKNNDRHFFFFFLLIYLFWTEINVC